MIPLAVRIASLLLSTIAVGVAAQTPGSNTAQQVRTTDSVIVSIHDSAAHVYRDVLAGFTDSLRVVISDSNAFAAFWRRLQPAGREPEPLPMVNFATHDVIVAALGAQGAEGPRMSIDTVAVRGETRVVVVRRTLYPAQCMNSTQAYELGRPVDVVVVPRASIRQTSFVERVVRPKRCSWERPATR